MMAFMSPKLWGALMLAAVLALSHAFIYRAGKASVRADWDAEKIAAQARAASAEAENRRLETLRQSRVIEAQNAQVKRNQILQAAAAGARAESDGLRGDLARNTADLSRATVEACRKYAATANAILGAVEAAGAGLAKATDGHASDALMFDEAWPR